MSSVRLRRLQADYKQLQEYVRRHPRLRLVQAEGDPPERYQLEYQVKGLRQIDDELQVVSGHLVEIVIPRNYPRTPPQCRMLTPVFHPNIAPHAICIGDHWSAGESLASMVARIGEMIAYQSYNTKSPLNGEAARWVEQNEAHLPLDRVKMHLDGPPGGVPRQSRAPSPASAGSPPASGPSLAAATTEIECPACRARYAIPAQTTAKRARCKRCQAIIAIPPRPAGP
jgi:ubiquitin-protein ligase